MKALVTANFASDALDRLADLGCAVEYAPIEERDGRLPEAEFRDRVRDVEVLVVGYEGVSEAVLDAASDLRVVACTRGGPEASVDIEAATERGIPVLYAPGRNAVSVADFTWGMILAVARNVARGHHLLRQGTYTGQPRADAAAGGEREDVTWGMGQDSPYVALKGPELAGKTVGVVGMGAIGRKVAERAQGFGVDLLGHDPYVDAEAMASYDVEKTGLDALCRRSDVVTVHCPVTNATRGLFGSEEFAAMKEGAFFVNTARAAVVDEDALVDQLRTGGIRGAALDVYAREPISEDHPLLELDNVVTTPHIAGAAEEVVDRHSAMLVADIEAVLAGERPEHVANEAVLQ